MYPLDFDHLRAGPFGRLAAHALNLVPSGMQLPIPTGPLRGMRWIVGASVHSCWLGLYERDKLHRMREQIHAGDVVYDIGAQAGYHMLMAARLVGEYGRVYAFEPLPRNADYVARHIAINSLANTELVNAAVTDVDRELCFDPGQSFMAGHVSTSGPILVRGLSLDHWRELSGARPPSFLKIDVEGAECKVLYGGMETIRKYRPVLALDTHDFLGGECVGIHEECRRILEHWGYETFTEPMDNPLYAKHMVATARAGSR